MRLLRFLPQADVELTEAAIFYDQEKPGLGWEFSEEFEKSLKNILEHPEIAPKISRDLRKERMNRFPYAIIFRIKAKEALIVAVAHCSRRPGYWRNRV